MTLDWQGIAVLVVVGLAIAFLVLRFTGFKWRRQPPAQSYVSLSSLKKGKGRPRSGAEPAFLAISSQLSALSYQL